MDVYTNEINNGVMERIGKQIVCSIACKGP